MGAPTSQPSGIYMHEGTLLFHERAIKNLLSVIDFVAQAWREGSALGNGGIANSPNGPMLQKWRRGHRLRGGGVDDRAKLMASLASKGAGSSGCGGKWVRWRTKANAKILDKIAKNASSGQGFAPFQKVGFRLACGQPHDNAIAPVAIPVMAALASLPASAPPPCHRGQPMRFARLIMAHKCRRVRRQPAMLDMVLDSLQRAP